MTRIEVEYDRIVLGIDQYCDLYNQIFYYSRLSYYLYMHKYSHYFFLICIVSLVVCYRLLLNSGMR